MEGRRLPSGHGISAEAGGAVSGIRGFGGMWNVRKLWTTLFGRPPESIARKVGKDRSRRPVSRTIPCSILPSAFASFAQRFGKSGLSWTSRGGGSGPASARFVPSDPIPDPRIEVPLGDPGAVRLEAASSAADGRAW